MTKKSTYCALLPADDHTLDVLTQIASCLGIPALDQTKHGYHVTMLYDENNGTDTTGFVPDPDAKYKARITGFKIFGEASNQFLVLTLSSSDLIQRHNQIRFKGHRHSYPEFNPHVTLAKKNAGYYAVEALDVLDRFRFTELTFGSEYIQEID